MGGGDLPIGGAAYVGLAAAGAAALAQKPLMSCPAPTLEEELRQCEKIGLLNGWSQERIDRCKQAARKRHGQSYEPIRKHGPGAWGTEMDLDDKTAQDVLDKSILADKQRYGYRNGKIYEFQPDNTGGWHGYPIPGTEAPPNVLKELLNAGTITKAQYNRLRKGK